MRPQFHYVVMFDSETQTWSVDWETGDRVFAEGEVYDLNIGEWLSPRDNLELMDKYEEYGGQVEDQLKTRVLPKIVLAPTLGEEILRKYDDTKTDEGEEA